VVIIGNRKISNKIEITRIVPNQVEVILPTSFCSKAFDNKHLFTKLFSTQNKTGGGEIDELIYLPDQLKAIITYKQDAVAQNVLSKKEIAYCDYTFKIEEHSETIIQTTNETAKEDPM
jgi:hypothetical protein